MKTCRRWVTLLLTLCLLTSTTLSLSGTEEEVEPQWDAIGASIYEQLLTKEPVNCDDTGAWLDYKDSLIDLESFEIPNNKDNILRLQSLYHQILAAHPELYYVTEQTKIRAYQEAYISSIQPYYREEVATDAAQKAFSDRIAQALSEALAPGMTQLDKALALHDWLALNCAYDPAVANGTEAGSAYCHTAYGALMEGNAVCDGYARAYGLLLGKAGIPWGLVEGRDHAWNWVELEGKRYHVDVTADDPVFGETGSQADKPGFCRHDYFLVSSARLTDLHARYDPIHTYTNTEYETGQFFSGAQTAFFWREGAFQPLNGDNLAALGSVYMGSPLAFSDSGTVQFAGAEDKAWQASLRNLDSQSKNVTLMAASYAGSGKLLDLRIQDLTLPPGQPKLVPLGDEAFQTGSQIKIFVLERVGIPCGAIVMPNVHG